MKSKNKIPLRVKVPVFLALTLAFAASLVIVLDSPVEEEPLVCRLESSGPLQKDKKGMSFLSHLFRADDGNYYAGGLSASADRWELNRIAFAADGSPYLEAVAFYQNHLLSGGQTVFRRLGSFGTISFVQTQYEGREKVFGVGASNSAISPGGFMDFCGKPWPVGTEVTQLNESTALFWYKGQLGFYDLKNIGMLVPRGAGRTPETILGVSAGNLLSYMNCGNVTENSKAQVSAQPGVFAVYSGDKPEISIYSVAESNMQLNPVRLAVDGGTFNQFKILDRQYLALKTSGFLQSAETWKVRHLSESTKDTRDLVLYRPLALQRPVNEDGTVQQDVSWVLEEERKFFLWKKQYLAKISPSGEMQRYLLPVKVTEDGSAPLWQVLPGDKHLFVSDRSGKSSYQKIACP